MTREPGRNDQCPCGSGRKYKHCCLRANDASDFLWRHARAAEGRLAPELLQLAKEFGPRFVAAALEEFFFDFRERFAGEKGQMLTSEAVRDLDFELRDLYFYIEDEVWNPRLPELRNTDGDKLLVNGRELYSQGFGLQVRWTPNRSARAC
jgi:hypothetical protein